MANSIYTPKPKKNKFDLSREVKMSGNMGMLYPCYMQDIIPGDSFRVNTQQMVRFSPLLAPMMHNIDFKIDYFFVPYRLVWSEWKDFITGGEDGNDLPSHPRFNVTTQTGADFLQKGSLADYMGIPPYSAGGQVEPTAGAWKDTSGQIPTPATQIELSLLPFRAYQLIWHEYFRDQNVGDEHEQFTSSGYPVSWSSPVTSDLAKQVSLRRTNWEKDYFTSSLPFLQRGGEVVLPLGSTAPLLFGDYDNNSSATASQSVYGSNLTSGAGTVNVQANNDLLGNQSLSNVNIDVSDTHVVDLSNATGATINELRKASALQQWLELMARAGSRYREQIHAIFGERIPDYTVQVPQYLGGGKTPIMISEVLSTYAAASTPATGGTKDRPMGDMAGHALGLGDGVGFQQSFDEHGIVLGLCRVVPKSSYNQGISKFWSKFDKFDHYFPQFANLGEQEVKNSELYVSGDVDVDNTVFGYQQRYAEYKYAFNRIAGDFRDNLAHWELSRRFQSAPLLNQSFVECNPDSRIFAITDEEEHKIWISLYHKVDALRPMPYHSNPSLT
jgi:hypothetical protein